MHHGDSEPTHTERPSDRAPRNSSNDSGGVSSDVPGDGRCAVRSALDGRTVSLVSAGIEDDDQPAILGRGQRPPGTGGTDGGPERPAGGEPDLRGPRFDREVPDGGYQWHYVDGVSHDGNSGIVVIALVGNPFSPWYARARDVGCGRALDYCSMNVAVYGRRASAWALTERRIAAAHRERDSVSIGMSRMRWEGSRLVIEVNERTALGFRIQGTVTLEPEAPAARGIALDVSGHHHWWPISPLAQIEVDLRHPELRFSGYGYHDANAGAASLDSAFERWTWSRARTKEGAVVTYDSTGLDGVVRPHALRVSRRGEVEDVEGLTATPIDTTRWRIAREARADVGHLPRVARSLEDGPFYARALVETRFGGAMVLTMHETLAADRLRARWVRKLTKFRMRRVR